MIFDQLIIAAVGFGRNCIGIITKPYETYRRMVDRANVWELVYIAGLLWGYFALASLVRQATFRPFLLTRQFLFLALGASSGFVAAVAVLWLGSRLVGGRGRLRGLAVAWAYTLIPTLLWFLATSLLYVFLPPPRTQSLPGVVFSIVYLVFSVTLFLWKATLSYLTLRFGMRLDLGRILLVGLLAVPMMFLYSIVMYRLGIFTVPFL